MCNVRASKCRWTHSEVFAHRRTLEAQLRRLGRQSVDFWVLRGFSEPQVSVEETMAVVKVSDSSGDCASKHCSSIIAAVVADLAGLFSGVLARVTATLWRTCTRRRAMLLVHHVTASCL